ncbi:Primary ciliary dyskinesia [Brachionus plicatilis]|uniref:Primary ciliary dyskinesia n=1 Tax=Brachionus plicatilis TaxID=10195 RepID=A0A3M7PBB7_BRAPC|nr:Primary ciliary dyskinesia [Brachionus plicatilis]
MASKVVSGHVEPIELNQNKKIPPIQPKRQPNRLKLTDSLVAPVEKIPVPNHLLDTKIFAKLQRNDAFEVSPVEVHFSGFEIDKSDQKRYTQILKVINISGQLQRMTVIPPQTKFFTIHYVKQERLVAGFALEIKVFFRPQEYKYYQDAIRIYSQN